MKTFLKWSGNKSKHISKFAKYLPKSFNTYIEPFVGSGALFLKLAPKKWIINDVNEDLMNVWSIVERDEEVIVENFKTFGEKLERLSKNRKIDFCKELTNNIPNMRHDARRASVFMLMKYCAYMGHIYVDNKFVFHGLDGSLYYDRPLYFLSDAYFENLKTIGKFMRESEGVVTNVDYKDTLKKARKGDFVFLDPPYIEGHNYKFNYNKDEQLDKRFLTELLSELSKLDEKQVMWMMTQADTEVVREVFKSYTTNTFQVYRPASKQYKNELVITNY
jgi:DNA adenine methylase